VQDAAEVHDVVIAGDVVEVDQRNAVAVEVIVGIVVEIDVVGMIDEKARNVVAGDYLF